MDSPNDPPFPSRTDVAATSHPGGPQDYVNQLVPTEEDRGGAFREFAAYFFVLATVLAFNWTIVAHPTETLYSPYSDVIAQHYPFRKLLNWSIEEYRGLPLWDPTSFGGKPLVGDPQSGLFYPPNWLHLLFGLEHTDAAFGWLMIAHLVIGGWGMLWWLKHFRDLANQPMARVAAAIAFAFCGKWAYHLYVPGHIVFWPLVFVPWQLGLITRIIARPQASRVAWLALVSVQIILGSHPQLMFYSQLLVTAYALVVLLRRRDPNLWDSAWQPTSPLPRLPLIGAHLIAAGLLTLALAAVHLVPIIDLLSQNSLVRAQGVPYSVAGRYAIEPWRLIQAVLPWYSSPDGWEPGAYLSGTALLIGLLAWRWRSLRIVNILFAVTILFALWFSTGEAGGLHPFFHEHVPGFKLFRIPSRMLLLLGIPVGYFAAAGLAALRSRGSAAGLVFFFAPLAVLGLVVIAIQPTVDGVLAGGAFLFPLLAVMPLPDGVRKLFAPLVLSWLIAQTALYVVPMIETRPIDDVLVESELIRKVKQPLGRGRVYPINTKLGADFTSLPTSYCGAFLIENVNGFNPLLPRGTFALMQCGVAQRPLEWAYGTAMGNPPIKSQHFLDLLGIQWIVSNQPLDLPGLKLEGEWDDLPVYHIARSKNKPAVMPKTYLYENPTRLPRASLVRRAELLEKSTLSSPDKIVEKLATTDPHQVVLLEGDESATTFPGEFEPVEVVHKGDGLEMEVDAGLGAYLVTREFWYPGWNVSDNGVIFKPLRVDGFFVGHRLSPGKHQIRIWYRPWSYLLGRNLTLFALLICLYLDPLGLAKWWRARKKGR